MTHALQTIRRKLFATPLDAIITLAVVLAASNRGGSRGGGDLSSRHPIVGSWAGDHIGVLSPSMAEGFDDVSSHIREALVAAGEATYEVSGRSVKRLPPPWAARAS